MTNLDKLKAEIAEMDAEAFSKKYGFSLHDLFFENYCVYHSKDRCPKFASCKECRVRWLNSEREESKEELK